MGKADVVIGKVDILHSAGKFLAAARMANLKLPYIEQKKCHFLCQQISTA